MTHSEENSYKQVHLVYQDPQFVARSQAASALRRLGNAFVRHRLGEDDLIALQELAEATAEALELSLIHI